MNVLTLENINRSYGEKVLFSDLSVYINAGEKVALVAKNGAGKTSLLNIIIGEESPEGENYKMYRNDALRWVYLQQDPKLRTEDTLLESILEGQQEWIDTLRQYYTDLSTGDEEAINKSLVRMEENKAWHIDARVRQLSGRFGFHDLTVPVGRLSGGQLKRLALVKLLSGEPDVLVLDEPTNHLDIEMIEWLENYLCSSHLTVFMVNT